MEDLIQKITEYEKGELPGRAASIDMGTARPLGHTGSIGPAMGSVGNPQKSMGSVPGDDYKWIPHDSNDSKK